MKKLMLLILGIALFIGCSKDEQKAECGVVIAQTFRNDGGVQEKVSMVACSDAWRSIEGTNIPNSLLFKKGVPRSTATYLVSIKTDTVYIRYEPGPVPTKTIDSFKNIGYTPKVTIISGLEHIKWP